MQGCGAVGFTDLTIDDNAKAELKAQAIGSGRGLVFVQKDHGAVLACFGFDLWPNGKAHRAATACGNLHARWVDGDPLVERLLGGWQHAKLVIFI